MMTPQGTSIPGEPHLRTAFSTLFLSQHFHQAVLPELMNNKYTAEKKRGVNWKKRIAILKCFSKLK